jgi:hypothetical protein
MSLISQRLRTGCSVLGTSLAALSLSALTGCASPGDVEEVRVAFNRLAAAQATTQRTLEARHAQQLDDLKNARAEVAALRAELSQLGSQMTATRRSLEEARKWTGQGFMALERLSRQIERDLRQAEMILARLEFVQMPAGDYALAVTPPLAAPAAAPAQPLFSTQR